ncbi:MAG: DNA internalization-related competence protein ComEC/Rec2 [Dehalococcoidia bacterium]
MTLPALATAWFLGFAAVATWDAPWWIAGAWCAAVVPLGTLRWRRRGTALAAAAVLVALAGGWRYAGWEQRDPPDLARFVDQQVELSGTVSTDPDPGLTTVRYRVDVDLISAAGSVSETRGSVLVTLNQYAEFLPGDRVRLTGKLEAPRNFDPGFDYRAYLARQGVAGTMLFPRVTPDGGHTTGVGRVMTRARLALERSLQRALPEPEASLGAGIGFGRDQGLAPALEQDFRDAGLSHIVAVSGANVALVAAIAFVVFVPLVGRYWAILPASLLVMVYLGVAGFQPSVVRATIMAGLYMAGLWLGRPKSTLAALAAAAVVMSAVQPGIAADAGFQLSFAATAGLITFGPWIRWLLEGGLARLGLRSYVPTSFLEVAAFTLAAALATLPVSTVTFGRLSLVGPFANAVAAPAVVVAMPLSLATALAGLAWEPAGWIIGLAAYYPLTFVTWVARTAAAVPGAAIDTPIAAGGAAFAAYAAMLSFAFLAHGRFVPASASIPSHHRQQVVRRAALAAAGGALAVAIIPVSIMPLGHPDRLTVQFLNVGQGDAILVTTPGGHRLLVDSGPSAIGLARELGAVLPHWERQIDMVLLTHPQEDHGAGFPALFERFDVGASATNGRTGKTVAMRLFTATAPEPRVVRAGDRWTTHGVTFDVLWPPAGQPNTNTNDASIVLRISYGEVTFLLTGDIEAPAQRDLIAREALRADVLKVPHHGSKTSAAEFFEAVAPAVAVISVGAQNRFGHPAGETLEALGAARVLRTDCNGRTSITTDGRTIRVKTERNTTAGRCAPAGGSP